MSLPTKKPNQQQMSAVEIINVIASARLKRHRIANLDDVGRCIDKVDYRPGRYAAAIFYFDTQLNLESEEERSQRRSRNRKAKRMGLQEEPRGCTVLLLPKGILITSGCLTVEQAERSFREVRNLLNNSNVTNVVVPEFVDFKLSSVVGKVRIIDVEDKNTFRVDLMNLKRQNPDVKLHGGRFPSATMKKSYQGRKVSIFIYRTGHLTIHADGSFEGVSVVWQQNEQRIRGYVVPASMVEEVPERKRHDHEDDEEDDKKESEELADDLGLMALSVNDADADATLSMSDDE